MDDLTVVHVKKRMTTRHELTLQEQVELELRLTDLYINSKQKDKQQARIFVKKELNFVF
jgi:hypothetical protein